MSRGRKCCRAAIMVLSSMMLFLYCYCVPVCAQAEAGLHRVLFISSYSYTWPTVPLQVEGIRSALDHNVELDIEFMDTKTLSMEIAQSELLERLRFKKEHTGSYQAVIVGDDAALGFVMEYREELFPGLPVVFEGINNIEYAQQELVQAGIGEGVLGETWESSSCNKSFGSGFYGGCFDDHASGL